MVNLLPDPKQFIPRIVEKQLEPPKLLPLAAMVMLGKRLKLDVGEPLEKVRNPRGGVFEGRDDLGLRMDPKLYANTTCGSCCGEGVITTRVSVTSKMLERLVKENPANAALVSRDEKRVKGQIISKNNHIKQTTTCGCVPRRYERARRQILAELALVETF